MPRSYFDHNATTPVSQEVLEVLVPVLAEVPGNPSSIHQDGQIARQKLEQSRRQIAAFLNCDSTEIVFTSGGTEANNLALAGVRPTGHIISTAIEHPAVQQPLQALLRDVDVTFVRPGTDGRVDPGAIREALRPETSMISVMHVNNETGAVQPVADIAGIAREAGAIFHSDGIQAPGRTPVDVKALGVDLYSISGHKMYAPKGIGVLFVRKGLDIAPQILGGRHEHGRRAGTENVAGAVAMGAAASWLTDHGAAEEERLSDLRDLLERKVLDAIPDVRVNGAGARAANTTNFCFDGIEGEALVIALDLRGFAVSSGSACSSGAVAPSHVLIAMGLTREQAKASIRVSLGRVNTREQVEAFVGALEESVAHLRRVSPVYRRAAVRMG